jgi:phage-related holin
MEIDYSKWGYLKPLIYIVVSAYTWVDNVGVNAYVFSVLAVFMVMDMILGVWKASVVKGLNNPTSRRAKKGILTKLIVLVIPVVVGLIWGAFDKENALRIVNVLLGALMVAEGYSNIGNAYSIYTGEVLSEFDAVTFVIKKVSEKIKTLLEKIIDDEI